MLLVNHDGAWRRRDWAALGLALFALLWSGVAVLLVVVCVLVVLCAAGIKQAATFAIPPAVVYIVWAAVYPPSTDLAAPTVRAFSGDLWPFVATGLSTAADAFVLDAPLLGSVGLVLLALYLVRTAERATTELAVVYACAAGAVAQLVLVGLRPADARHRAGGGDAVRLHRDHPAGTCDRDGRDRLIARADTPVRAGFVVVFVLMTVTNAAPSPQRRVRRGGARAPVRAAILAAAQIANDPVADARAGRRFPSRIHSPDLTVARPPPLRRERRVALVTADAGGAADGGSEPAGRPRAGEGDRRLPAPVRPADDDALRRANGATQRLMGTPGSGGDGDARRSRQRDRGSATPARAPFAVERAHGVPARRQREPRHASDRARLPLDAS